MSTQAKLSRDLQKFGLSQEQAYIYLCLVQEGELRIQELAKMSGLPRSSVYEHLKHLFNLGLAEEVLAGSYKKIRPYPLSVLKHDLAQKVLDINHLQSELKDLEKDFELFANNTSFPSMSVRYYKDVAGARQVLWNSLKATSTVHVYSSWGRSLYVGKKFYENFVDESKRRRISEEVLLNPGVEVLGLLKEHLGTSVARTRLEDIRAISDKKILITGETLIYNNVFAQVYLRGQEINGFEIENRYFTDSQVSIFNTLWSMGQPVQSLL